MEKLVYLLWKDGAEERSEFCGRLLEQTAGALQALEEVKRLQLNLADDAIRPGESMLQCNTVPRPYASLSLWVDSASKRKPVEEQLGNACPRFAGYLVTESVPIVNTTATAPHGQRTPGFSQCTMLQCPPRLARADWLKIWLESHTQVAIDTQSTYLYVQNIFTRALTYGAPHYDAMVEEGFPEAALTDWAAFYDSAGDKEKFKRHQQQMIDSCQRFIDFDRLDVMLTSQYVIS